MNPPDKELEAAIALVKRIKDRWKKRAAELHGRRKDIDSAKADGISDCYEELTIHWPKITDALTAEREAHAKTREELEKEKRLRKDEVDWWNAERDQSARITALTEALERSQDWMRQMSFGLMNPEKVNGLIALNYAALHPQPDRSESEESP